MLDQIEDAKASIIRVGGSPKYLIMNRKTLGKLRKELSSIFSIKVKRLRIVAGLIIIVDNKVLTDTIYIKERIGYE